MKKLSLVLVVLVMLFAALACGGESTPAPEAQSITEKQVAKATAIPTARPTKVPTQEPVQASIDDTILNMQAAGYGFWEIEGEGYLWANDDASMLCAFAVPDYAILCDLYPLDGDMVQAGEDMVYILIAYGVPLNTVGAIGDDMINKDTPITGLVEGWKYSVDMDVDDMSITVTTIKQ